MIYLSILALNSFFQQKCKAYLENTQWNIKQAEEPVCKVSVRKVWCLLLEIYKKQLFICKKKLYHFYNSTCLQKYFQPLCLFSSVFFWKFFEKVHIQQQQDTPDLWEQIAAFLGQLFILC